MLPHVGREEDEDGNLSREYDMRMALHIYKFSQKLYLRVKYDVVYELIKVLSFPHVFSLTHQV